MKEILTTTLLFISVQWVIGQTFESTASLLDMSTLSTEGKVLTHANNCYSFGIGYTDYLLTILSKS